MNKPSKSKAESCKDCGRPIGTMYYTQAGTLNYYCWNCKSEKPNLTPFESHTIESESDYDQRMADREQDRYDMYEDGRSEGHGESYAERNA